MTISMNYIDKIPQRQCHIKNSKKENNILLLLFIQMILNKQAEEVIYLCINICGISTLAL